MVKPEKFDHFHLVYYFAVPLKVNFNLRSTAPPATFFANIKWEKWWRNPTEKSRKIAGKLSWKSSFICLEHTVTKY